MNNNASNYSYKFRPKLEDRAWNDPAFEGLFPAGDLALFDEITEHMQAVNDIETVKRDPEYSKVSEDTAIIITGHNQKGGVNPETEKFIRSTLTEQLHDAETEDEISRINTEADETNVREITAGWVKEWLLKRGKNEYKDPKREEIREYITTSLKQEKPVSGTGTEVKERSIPRKSLIIRYTSLAAAVVIGAVFLIRSLLPAGDSQRLFNKYYEPFNAVSAVTRGMADEGRAALSRAIDSYRTRDYKSAEAEFAAAMKYETVTLPAGFFLGITEIELDNTGRAEELLENVVNRQGAYSKEATWYLGLTYVKSGNKSRALECFDILAGSPGFYHERAEEILRRLR